MEVYHGKNSEYIEKILDSRWIIHHTFNTDKQNKNKIESALNFFQFGFEAKKTQKAMKYYGLVIWKPQCR